jgi:hypothetical protein
MDKERQNIRFDPAVQIVGYFELCNEVTGEFQNHEEFIIKNISLGGFNLISNFPPAIENKYKIFIHYDNGKHDYEIKVIHSRILRFQDNADGVLKPGIVYSTGCLILDETDQQKDLVLEIIKNDCGYPAPAETAS